MTEAESAHRLKTNGDESRYLQLWLDMDGRWFYDLLLGVDWYGLVTIDFCIAPTRFLSLLHPTIFLTNTITISAKWLNGHSALHGEWCQMSSSLNEILCWDDRKSDFICCTWLNKMTAKIMVYDQNAITWFMKKESVRDEWQNEHGDEWWREK